MNVLHISNDFPNSKLYTHLVAHIDRLNISQIIYSAVRAPEAARYDPFKLRHLDTKIRNILYPHDRILYRLKIRKIFQDVLKQVDVSQVDLIHTHTLYSDGAVALQIKKKYGIPYITAIRSTDLIAFQTYRPDLRLRRNKILREAEKVIFISWAHRKKFLFLLGSNIRAIVDNKSVTLPNGIDPVYFNCSFANNRVDKSVLKLIYVGKFLDRKNIQMVIKAVEILSTKQSIILTIVGGGGDADEEIKEMIKCESYPFINYLGRIEDKNKLREVYQSHDIFIMPSDRETFGLVYIEALSQGLPIIYTKGEGVDGYFEEGTIGESIADTQNPNEIARKIMDLSHRLNKQLRKQCIKKAQQFDWAQIAADYNQIYSSIVKKVHT